MDGVWAALRYDQHLIDIADHFTDGQRIAVIEGPPGVGKSWLAKGFGASWEDGGGSAIVAEGDIGRSHFDYYPFGLAMAGLSSGWSGVGAAAAGAARAAETLLGTAGIITSTVQGLTRLRKSRRLQKTIFLGDREQEILANLERLGRKRPILLIADNLHWWDAGSLHLLRELVEPVMQDAFPFLADLRILAVQTPAPYQETVHEEVLRNALSGTSPRRVRLPRIAETQFGAVLVGLGLDARPEPELSAAIYDLCGGHLTLASRAVDRIGADGADALLAAHDSHEFVRSLVTERITALGEVGQQAIALLQTAAVLGLAFRRDEILCAVEEDDRSAAALLRLCRDERLLEVSDRDCRFVHDLYREFFLSAGDSDRVSIHERLSECLRELRSGEYDLRSQNAVRAEQPTNAGALGVLACLRAVRDGNSWSDISPTTLGAVRVAGLEPAASDLAAAIGHLNSYDYRSCLSVLDALPRDLPKAVAAEADYIRAMSRMSTRSEEDRDRGRTTLAAWSGLEDEEPELGVRLARLRLYGLTHLADKEPGRELEAEIRQRLIDRVSIDATARDDLYVLDRCAASLYQPDVSVRRNAQAVEYFAPTDNDTTVRKPLEYYRSLVNYGAGLTGNARYREALDTYATVRALVDSYPDGTFPRVDYPLSNELAVKVRLGRITAADALPQQRQIVRDHGVEGDPFYVQNAVAVYMALSGDAQSAVDVLDALIEELRATRVEPESSTQYLLGANRCCALRSSGARGLAETWDALRPVVEDIRYVIRPYLLRRHDLLAPVFETSDEMSAGDIDGYVQGIAPSEFGPLWQNYNRGFRLPEVEFWREN